MADAAQTPCIYVLAGTNGAGKSSIGGAMLLQKGVEYFNPDEAARLILSANPGSTQRSRSVHRHSSGTKSDPSCGSRSCREVVRSAPRAKMGQADPGGGDGTFRSQQLVRTRQGKAFFVSFVAKLFPNLQGLATPEKPSRVSDKRWNHAGIENHRDQREKRELLKDYGIMERALIYKVVRESAEEGGYNWELCPVNRSS